MRDQQRQVPVLVLAALGSVLLLLPTCRSTEHTVARIVVPTPGAVEVEAPPPVEPAAPRATAAPIAPAVPQATRTPSPVSMPVVTAPPGSRSDRSPGVLYEELVPTARAITPLPTRTAARVVTALPIQTAIQTVTPLPTRTPTRTTRPAAGPGGAYYEDEQGRPVTTPTPERR